MNGAISLLTSCYPYLRIPLVCLFMLFLSCQSKTSNKSISISSDTTDLKKSTQLETFPNQEEIVNDLVTELSNRGDCKIFTDIFVQNNLSSIFAVGKDWNFALFVPTDNALNSLKSAEKEKFISASATKLDKIKFINNHISNMTRGYPWLGGPSISNIELNLKDLKIVEFGSDKSNVIETKTTPLGNQIIIIDKPILSI
ncbi:MAG: fasciclin domain-containing protein [Saprospiraceae bacterium]|nr:fasciclin domain-containing protein [Candidatus Defluviibacterium haderslevense]MCC7028546.1 fasciclin domain-containing protein [Saprospiraceae bacterium]